MPLSQVGEVMNHAGTIFIPLIMIRGHALIKQIFSAHINRRKCIILSQERNLIANHAFMTISGVVDQDCAIIVPHEATLVFFNKSS